MMDGLAMVFTSALIIFKSPQINKKSQEVFEQVLGIIKLVECAHMKNINVWMMHTLSFGSNLTSYRCACQHKV
jgi:hypothetical protein